MMLGNKEVTLIQEMILHTYSDLFVITPVKPSGVQQHIIIDRTPGIPDSEIMTLRGMHWLV